MPPATPSLECLTKVWNKAHHHHPHPTAHSKTVPSTSTHPQRYLWKHPMVSGGRFLLGARKEGKDEESVETGAFVSQHSAMLLIR